MTSPEGARELIDDVIRFDSSQHRFLELLDHGEIRPDVLPLPALHQRITANPGLRWRLQAGAAALEER